MYGERCLGGMHPSEGQERSSPDLKFVKHQVNRNSPIYAGGINWTISIVEGSFACALIAGGTYIFVDDFSGKLFFLEAF